MSDTLKDLKARENLRDWLEIYTHAIPKESVKGQLMDSQERIEQQQARIAELQKEVSFHRESALGYKKQKEDLAATVERLEAERVKQH